MLTREQLVALHRSLEGERVLSVYIDATAADPANRRVWRVQLDHAVKDLRTWLGDSPRSERGELDQCVALLEQELAAIEEPPRAPGWVAFITPYGVQTSHALPMAVPTFAVWSTGICAAPYIRALKALRPVIVAIADARRVTLHRYASGTLDRVETLRAHHAALQPTGTSAPPSAGFHPGTRGGSARDTTQQALLAGRDRMLAEAAEHIRALAGTSGWIVLGGIPRVVARLTRALGPDAPHRVLARTALDVHATEAQIAAAARHAASTLRDEVDALRVAEIGEAAAAGGLGAIGPDATQRALEQSCVSELYLSHRYLADNGAEAEDLVRAALNQNAVIEEVSGEGAAYLDVHGGVAARLRWRAAAAHAALAAAGFA